MTVHHETEMMATREDKTRPFPIWTAFCSFNSDVHLDVSHLCFPTIFQMQNDHCILWTDLYGDK